MLASHAVCNLQEASKRRNTCNKAGNMSGRVQGAWKLFGRAPMQVPESMVQKLLCTAKEPPRFEAT